MQKISVAALTIVALTAACPSGESSDGGEDRDSLYERGVKLCDDTKECEDLNTAGYNACTDVESNNASQAEDVGCIEQLAEFYDCVDERARCERGNYVYGGCDIEARSLNNCFTDNGGTANPGGGDPGGGDGGTNASTTDTGLFCDALVACGEQVSGTCAADLASAMNTDGCNLATQFDAVVNCINSGADVCNGACGTQFTTWDNAWIADEDCPQG